MFKKRTCFNAGKLAIIVETNRNIYILPLIANCNQFVNSFSGKTSFIERYVKNKFIHAYKPTVSSSNLLNYDFINLNFKI